MKKYDVIEEMTLLQVKRLKNNYKRAYDYHRELFKDDYPNQIKQGREKYSFTNITFDFEASDYIFYTFNTWDIGAPVALSLKDFIVVQGIHINYCIFENCNIKNIIFRNCSFSGSKFKNVKFERVNFENCMFSVPVIERGSHEVDDTYYAPTIFEKCIFVADFSDCDLENTLFERVNFTLSKFQRTSLQYSIMTTCAISSTEMKDCNLQDFTIYKTDILDISFTDERLTTVNENTFIDYLIKSKRKDADKKNESGWKANNYDDMCLKNSKTIKNFARLFSENEYPDYEGEYFYRAKKTEFKALHGGDKIKSVISLLLCGYGERPSFTLGTILISMFIFGFIYMFSGIDAAGDIIKYSFNGNTSVMEAVCDYGKCLFFSVTTFSTVGYGNYVPLGTLSMIISGIHMIVGVSLCALWTGCIFHKISR